MPTKHRPPAQTFADPVSPRPAPPPKPRAMPALATIERVEPTTRVILVWRRGLSSAREEREVVWPAGWRLPTAGDAVHLSSTEGGFVEYVDWDFGQGAVRVNLR